MSCIILPTGARTTTQTSVDISSARKEALHLVVDVTANAGSITPKIEGKDANGIYYTILTGVALTSTGTTILKVGRGMLGSANYIANDQLPAWFRVTVTANNANSVTYSVGAELM